MLWFKDPSVTVYFVKHVPEISIVRENLMREIKPMKKQLFRKSLNASEVIYLEFFFYIKQGNYVLNQMR